MRCAAVLALRFKVPFFIAAYHFLNNLEALQGQSWGPIRDLARPDTLLRLPPDIFSGQVHLLPWLMTLLNLLSSAAYLSQLEVRSKAARIQFLGIAFLFLVLLYRAPAALLLYWSFSNLYSLCKNLISATIKGGYGYWRLLWQQSRQLGLHIWEYLCAFPYLVLLEYFLFTAGLFLLARFKVLDSLDDAAQYALFWGKACWSTLIFVQILRCLGPSKGKIEYPKEGLPTVLSSKLRFLQNYPKKKSKRILMAALYSLVLCSAFLVPRLAAVVDYLGTVEIFAVTPAILAFGIFCTFSSRLCANRAYSILLAKNKEILQLGQLALASILALLGLVAFHSSSLLRSSTGESLEAIPDFLYQLLPSVVAWGLGLILLWFWLIRRRQKGKYSWLRQIAFWGSGLLLVALSNSFALQYDYGVMTSWVFDQPEKLLIPWPSVFLALLPLPLLYGLWLFLLKRLHIFLPLVWITCASLWLGYAHYSRDLWNNLKESGLSENTESPGTSLESVFSYSRNHTNVVVIMLDRFIGPYIEQLLELEPSLKTDLAGFTWYKNTSSPGPSTISGLTALLGGHEYSPDQIGKLPGSLRDKVNQAYLMLPTLFEQNGFTTTVSDPSWANFSWKGDLELFRKRGIRAERLKGRYTGEWLGRETAFGAQSPGFRPNYSAILLWQAMFRSFPPPLAVLIYDNGSWLGSNFPAGNLFFDLLGTWAPLVLLPQLSDALADTPQFVFMTNDTPHEPMMMGYRPEDSRYPLQPVSQTEEPTALNSPFSASPRSKALFEALSESGEYSLRHFYANWATIREIQRYLAWMREQNVYDNSLIIIASDHGRDVFLPGYELSSREYGYFMPLLLVKLPQNPRETGEPLRIDETARSSADVAAFASLALPEAKRRNPFTKKKLELSDPSASRFAYYISINPQDQGPQDFIREKCYRIDGPIWEKQSWQKLP